MKDDRLVEMRVFKAVVDLGSFTAAAHHFSVSQPYISKVITNLEKRVGVALVHRTTRQQKITSEGEEFLSFTNKIISELDKVDQWAYDSKIMDAPSGELRVSAPIAFGIDQVSRLIPSFIDKYPNIQINLSLTDRVESLLDGSADVAIRMGKLPDSTLISKRLCDLNRVVVASPDYLKKKTAPQVPEDLKQHNCLMWSGGREHLNRWPFIVDKVYNEIAVKGNIKSSNGLALMNMCYRGVGIMRMAEHVALPAIRNGLIEEVLSDYHIKNDSGIYAVFLPERELIPRIRVFVDFMHSELRNNPWETLNSPYNVGL